MGTKETLKKGSKKIFNNRGSAIIFALITMTVLILLGVAIATLSTSTLNVNAADAQTNNSFYAGEASINSAVEQIKYEASGYYTDMLEAQGGEYTALYDSFFTAISGNAQSNFIEPAIDGVTTVTTFSNGSYDASQDIGEFLITCTATAADGTSYVVDGAVFIKRVDVSGSSTTNWIVGEAGIKAAIKAGGTLSLGKKNGVGVTRGGDIIVSELMTHHKRNWLQKPPYKFENGGELIISENVADTITDSLSYTSYSDPVISEVDVYVTKNNYTFNWGNVPDAPVGITTADGVKIKFASCTVPEGIVHGKGDIHINNGMYYADFYSDGDMKINNCSVYGDIYCRGDLNIINANIYGTIFCDGLLNFRNGSLKNTAVTGGGITMKQATCNGSLYSAGAVTVSQTGINGGIIYSSTKLTIGNLSASAVLFSAGDIELSNSLSVTGCIIAKQDIYFSNDSNKYMTVNYSQTTIDGLVYDDDNAYFFTSTEQAELNEDVFVDQTITAVGRVN